MALTIAASGIPGLLLPQTVRAGGDHYFYVVVDGVVRDSKKYRWEFWYTDVIHEPYYINQYGIQIDAATDFKYMIGKPMTKYFKAFHVTARHNFKDREDAESSRSKDRRKRKREDNIVKSWTFDYAVNKP